MQKVKHVCIVFDICVDIVRYLSMDIPKFLTDFNGKMLLSNIRQNSSEYFSDSDEKRTR